MSDQKILVTVTVYGKDDDFIWRHEVVVANYSDAVAQLDNARTNALIWMRGHGGHMLDMHLTDIEQEEINRKKGQ